MRNIFRQLKQVDEPVENNEDYNMDYYAGVGRTQAPVGTAPVGANPEENQEKADDSYAVDETAVNAEKVEPVAEAETEEFAEDDDYEEPEEDESEEDDGEEGYDVTIYAPEDNFSCADIVHDLANDNIVIINIAKMNQQTIIRTFDYIMGAVEALNAQLIRRGGDTVVIGPKSADLDDFCDNFTGYEFED